MPAREWDAIIVGAGPAGSALACRLSVQRRVLVLERTPRREIPALRIGESLPAAAGRLLQRCGAFARFQRAAHAERGATVSQWEAETPFWFDHLRDPDGAGWHLDRARFDADLRASAAEAGAIVHEGRGAMDVRREGELWRVDPADGGDIHRAPLLIDASGRPAAVARQLGLQRRVEDELICLYTHLPSRSGEDDHCTRLCADANGWWYSVRVPNGERVLAFHLDADDDELHRLKRAPALLQAARRHTLLAEVLPETSETVVHARPAGSAVLDLAAAPPGFFAIGDAGLSFDPIASQGMFHALASAESVANAIEQGTGYAAFVAEMRAVHAHYRRRFHQTYAAPVRFGMKPFWARRR